jgi:hypothetical protein
VVVSMGGIAVSRMNPSNPAGRGSAPVSTSAPTAILLG